MTCDEMLKCIKKINPDAHVAIWQDRSDEEPYPKWDDCHVGSKPTMEECIAILPTVRAEMKSEIVKADARAKLADIDIKCIRSLREWISQQPTAPQFVKDYEAQAQTERAKLK